ncbi:nitrous oxide reductase accessory protein NosL [Gracilibacillus salinarum]|uniref:Nitrous oxide reductase accessory protein NosL n=1 Tax=Gracilibacillus salinarum TaxID=2932255 RepID=A0ABY4GIM4_9BACI|nr:nitrous oxide reductase accessory protein NosL [Gracilibacillus salinarum]UOQ84084.1 nitrous oxide reductase accessory protein NosL [Gracilibacillus salinarum]
MKSIKFLGVLLCSLFILAACGNDEVQPVDIDESTDTCVVCNMQVMNSQFATEVVMDDDKVQKFDDIGCMYEWLHENGGEGVAAQFVRDYNTKDWVEGDQATYVYNQSVKTPMSYNVISFTEKEDAEQFVEENDGELLTYDQLQDHKWEMSGDMKEHNHSHGEEETTNGDEMDMEDMEMDESHSH